MKQCNQNKIPANRIKSDCCRNVTTFWVPPVPQPLTFTLHEAQLPFHYRSFPTKFTRCFLAVICSYVWGFWKWVHIWVCADWFSRAWPRRGLWGLHSASEPYFCLAYLKWQQQPQALTREPPLPLPALLQNHCSAKLLISCLCWYKMSFYLVLFLNW